MSRIVYLSFPNGEVAGGQKMSLRHVETLCELGFEAVFWRGASNRMPAWLEHHAPVEVETPFRPDDILVLPADAPNAIVHVTGLPQRSMIFCQGHNSFAAVGLDAVDRFPPERFPIIIAVGQISAAAAKRLYPEAQVEIIPCFADERVFRPGAARRPTVAFVPRKRPLEAQAIRNFLRKFHPRHAELPWTRIENASETEVAASLASSSLFLSLARFESVGMQALEAMACGCVCAGFTGIGGWEYATEANGFWAPEEDMMAAADALAQAADLARTGGPALRALLEAGYETARTWSYANFRIALEEVWMRLAPDARRHSGPRG